MTNISRRRFIRTAFVNAAKLGAAAVVAESAVKGMHLLELHDTWAEAAEPNDHFLSAHAARLQTTRIGGSFAPEQWWPISRAGEADARQALALAVEELDLRQMRLGLRWDRSVDRNGRARLDAYRPYLDYCFAHDVEVCLNVGPIRTFRWPEEHLPDALVADIPLPEHGTTIQHDHVLAKRALAYLDDLLAVLQRDYGPALSNVRVVQMENEPFYELGAHEWLMGFDYLEAVTQRVDAAFPQAKLLLTSAGRLNLHSIRNFYVRLLAQRPEMAGRLISGFDYHYRTPNRDSFPVVRHFDQVAYGGLFAPSLEDNKRDARDIGYEIEVTEGQAEPYGHFKQPGNSATDFRFLLLRCLDKVFPPDSPALLRIWGVEELTKKMLRGQLTTEHRQIIELIQTINQRPSSAPQARI